MSRKSFLNYKREKRQKMKIRLICILVVLLCCFVSRAQTVGYSYKPLAAEGCSMKYSDKFADGSLAFTNTFLCLTSWTVSFFSLANSLVSLANCFSELANSFESLANCFSELANSFKSLANC